MSETWEMVRKQREKEKKAILKRLETNAKTMLFHKENLYYQRVEGEKRYQTHRFIKELKQIIDVDVLVLKALIMEESSTNIDEKEVFYLN